jgi:signal transduction histidine kinase
MSGTGCAASINNMGTRHSRFGELGPWLLDTLLALSLALVAVANLPSTLDSSPLRPAGATAVFYGLALAHALPVVLHRRFPAAVLAWSLLVAAVALIAGPPLVFLGLTQVVILYSAAARCRRRTSLGGLVVAEIVWGVAVLQQAKPDGATWVVLGAVLAGAWLLGDNARRHEAHAAAQAVAEERMRIARELHDVVAHSISVIAVQSGVGAHVMDTDPGEARKALLAIEHTSREALEEMRRLLGVLRDGDAPLESHVPEPAPGLGRLDDLLVQARDAGLRVETDVNLPEAGRGLSPLTDLTAYRVVQEALTNVRKHARATVARVTIRRDGDGVLVQVDDDGEGLVGRRRRAEVGHGLVGMRERVSACGGVLEAGPTPAGGFRVVARLPIGSDR